MTTSREFYVEIAKAFSFPEYSGHNLNALFDSLTDLIWITNNGLVFLVTSSNHVLSKEPAAALQGFVDTLERAGNAWSECVDGGFAWDRPSIPFNTLFEFQTARDRDVFPLMRVIS